MLLFSIFLGALFNNTYRINSVRLVMNFAQLIYEVDVRLVHFYQAKKQTNKRTINNDNRTNKNTILIYFFVTAQTQNGSENYYNGKKNNVKFPKKIKVEYSFVIFA